MKTRQLIVYLSLSLFVVACGQGDDPTARHDGLTQAAPDRQSTQATAPGECGKGGTECPAGLECVTFRGGQQACGPESVDAVVLIRDGTLGGRCVSPNAADTYPGASIASIQVMGNDGNLKGHGRLEWEQAGFEVASDRGTPPDGTAFSGDACTDSYNIGCDGQAVFEIVGVNGGVQKLREGEMIIAHLRGQDSCGEAVADQLEAAICNNPAAALAGDLSSCISRVRMIQASADLYGSDRVGGTIQFLTAPE